MKRPVNRVMVVKGSSKDGMAGFAKGNIPIFIDKRLSANRALKQYYIFHKGILTDSSFTVKN